MCSPILWLAARPQRIARFAAFHVDCAPSAHEKVAIDSTQKIVASVKYWQGQTLSISARNQKSRHDNLQPDILRDGGSHSPSWSTFSATMFRQFITQSRLKRA